MSIFYVETYVGKAEKRAAFKPLLDKFIKYKKAHPQLFKGVKSWKLLRQEFGAIAGMYIEMWEYENWADIETINKRIFKDKEMQKIQKAFHLLIEPATFTGNIWHPIA